MHQIACRVSSSNFHKFSEEWLVELPPQISSPLCLGSGFALNSTSRHRFRLCLQFSPPKFWPGCSSETRLWHLQFQTLSVVIPQTPVRLMGSEDDGRVGLVWGPTIVSSLGPQHTLIRLWGWWRRDGDDDGCWRRDGDDDGWWRRDGDDYGWWRHSGDDDGCWRWWWRMVTVMMTDVDAVTVMMDGWWRRDGLIMMMIDNG